MKTDVKNYKNFVIKTEEGIEKGFFFRNPIQKVSFGVWDEDGYDAYTYLEKIKSPLFRFKEILKGNYNIVSSIKEWSEGVNWAGFTANVLCLPIYFKRPYRQLEAYSQSTDANIQSIHSYGYESQFNKCGGSCVIEKTTMKTKNNKKMKMSSPESFHYTYSYIIEDIIDTENIS